MTLVPSFCDMINYFTVPQNLSFAEQKQFVETALEVDVRITEESKHKNFVQFTWSKDVLGRSVVEAIESLCSRAGYKVSVGSNISEWVVDVRFA